MENIPENLFIRGVFLGLNIAIFFSCLGLLFTAMVHLLRLCWFLRDESKNVLPKIDRGSIYFPWKGGPHQAQLVCYNSTSFLVFVFTICNF